MVATLTLKNISERSKTQDVKATNRFELARPKPLDDMNVEFKSNPLTTLAQCQMMR